MSPTKLPNGVLVFNATPHPLYFLCDEDAVVVVPSDKVVNAIPITETVLEHEKYTLNTVTFTYSMEGKATIREFKEREPEGLVVGSIIAAQAFPEEVVAPIPTRSDRVGKRSSDMRLVRSDRFTVYTKKGTNNGSC